MRTAIYSFLIFAFTVFITALQAQSGYIDKVEEFSETDLIYGPLNTMDTYHPYGKPVASVYDSLIQNVHGFQSHEVPTYSDEIISQRMLEIPAVIPMDFNVYVRRYIDVYTRDRREQVSRMLGLARVYFPIFEKALDREGMPIELKYLAIVESALNPKARSRAQAVGLWQFMLSTGRMYGLEGNSFIDERMNPYKSTDAALRYLKDAYNEFGDWQLAIASYNCGRGNVRKAIARSGGQRNFWAIRPYLPRETRGYVPAFIAANYTFHFAASHNLYPLHLNFDFDADTVHIRRMDIRLADIAQMTGTRLDIIKALNPELKLDRVPYSSRIYALRVPYSVSSYFHRNKAYLQDKYGKKATYTHSYAYKSARKPATPNVGNGRLRYHTVKNGEVVGAIAEAYGVSSRNIARWNGLRGYRIKVGQKLKIYSNAAPKPVKKQEAATRPQQMGPQPTGQGTYYTIKNRDTLWDIAKKYPGVTTQSIIRLNPGLNTRDLKVGTRIRVK